MQETSLTCWLYINFFLFSIIIIFVTHLQKILQILNLIDFFQLALLKVLKSRFVNFQISVEMQFTTQKLELHVIEENKD